MADPTRGFGHAYPDARRLFLEAAQAAGAHVTSYECPRRGPDGIPLFSDLAWIGPADAERVLFTISGTHGVEGIAGSGIQLAAIASGLYGSPPPGVAIALLHALTPHGFAWLRRCNEDGVDVCRNFVDFEAPRPGSDFYREFAHDLVPREWSGDVRAAADERLYGYVAQHGVERFTAELARGQYDHDFAPFFGGRAPAWSNRTLREIFRTRLSAVRRLFVIDYHTGLGESGTGQLLGFDHPSDPGGEGGPMAYGAKFVPLTSEESIAYEVVGDIAEPLAEELSTVEVVAAAHEFGTVDAISVLQALRGDHWLHRHGELDSVEGRRIKDEIRSAFYSADPRWQRSVSELAVTAEREALAALSAR